MYIEDELKMNANIDLEKYQVCRFSKAIASRHQFFVCITSTSRGASMRVTSESRSAVHKKYKNSDVTAPEARHRSDATCCVLKRLDDSARHKLMFLDSQRRAAPAGTCRTRMLKEMLMKTCNRAT